MAEDLAKAIVRASVIMHRRDEPPPTRIATISAGHFDYEDDFNFSVRGVDDDKAEETAFFFLEDALNFVWKSGFVRMNRDDEKEWKANMKEFYGKIPDGPRSYERGRIVMVFSKTATTATRHNKAHRGSGPNATPENENDESNESFHVNILQPWIPVGALALCFLAGVCVGKSRP